MTERELALIKRAFVKGMEAEHLRLSERGQARYLFETIFHFGIEIGEERGRGLAKRKPLKENA